MRGSRRRRAVVREQQVEPTVAGLPAVSFDALRWALSVHAPDATAKAVLVALANEHRSATPAWRCWPSVDTIAGTAQLSRTATKSALRRLEAAELLEIESSPGRRSNRYRLAVTGHLATGSLSTTGHDTTGSNDANRSPENANRSPGDTQPVTSRPRTRNEPGKNRGAAQEDEPPRPRPPLHEAAGDAQLSENERAEGLARVARLREQMQAPKEARTA